MIDFSNDASSGTGWTTGPDGLPKLPITSVAVVLGVGGLILEAASHAPLLGLFMPRVLQVCVKSGGRACTVPLLCAVRCGCFDNWQGWNWGHHG